MSTAELPSLPNGFEYRLDLRHHVTPRLLKDEPIHRWFWFPHSFSPHLIDEILKECPLPQDSNILDPFVGAGTTVLRARQLGLQAVGADLSPLSIFVSRVKLSRLDKKLLREYLRYVLDYTPAKEFPSLPKRLKKAFTLEEMAQVIGLRQRIGTLPQPTADFFLLALLRVQQRASRAVPNGGWFRWVEKEDQSEQIASWFEQQCLLQIADLSCLPDVPIRVFADDARRLEQIEKKFDLVITSPPYPNRHDYSRIFHIELLSLGLDEPAVKQFRRESIRSHVEAAVPALDTSACTTPPTLQKVLNNLPSKTDPRIAPMLQGYFEDMYLTLKALSHHLKVGALCAFVVGNVRHAGIMVPVDEILRDVGEQAGYDFDGAWVARLRGNSAQQMGRFGRKPARESVVFLRKC